MRFGIAASMAMTLAIAGCASARALHSQGQQGSAYHPPDASTLHDTGTPAPTSALVPVNLTGDGFYTPDGMRISFLRECAEDTLKNQYDSFALFHYTMKQTAPRKFEAHGEIIESRGHYDEPANNLFDARKVLADPAI